MPKLLAVVVIKVLRFTLRMAFVPQTVRIGGSWIKKDGRKDPACVPAVDLGPDEQAEWIRATFQRYLTEVLGVRKAGRAKVALTSTKLREERWGDRDQVPGQGDYTVWACHGAEEAIIGNETVTVASFLTSVLALAQGEERRTMELILEGLTQKQIGERINRDERTGRRHLERLRKRIASAGLARTEPLRASEDPRAYWPQSEDLGTLVRLMTPAEREDQRAGYARRAHRRLMPGESDRSRWRLAA